MSRNLTNLIDRVQWARLHDSEVRLIAQRASGRMAHLFSERNRACATFEAIRTIAQDQISLEYPTKTGRAKTDVLRCYASCKTACQIQLYVRVISCTLDSIWSGGHLNLGL